MSYTMNDIVMLGQKLLTMSENMPTRTDREIKLANSYARLGTKLVEFDQPFNNTVLTPVELRFVKSELAKMKNSKIS